MKIKRKHWLVATLMAFCAGYAAGDLAQAHSQHPNTAALTRMDSCLNTFSVEKTKSIEAGWIHWFTEKELTGGLNLKMTRVDRRQAYHAAHKHADPEIIFILEGHARLTLEEEERIAPRYTSLYCPPGLMHGISRASEEPLQYLIIRTN